MEEISFIFFGITVFICFICPINCFNLDTKVPIVKLGSPNSYFGFSIAQHQVYDDKLSKSSHVILVGAPLDNVTDSTVPQEVRNLAKPGVIYRCPFTSMDDDCEWIKLDAEVPDSTSIKDGMWLGVSVASQGTPDGQAVACAHRMVKGNENFRHGLGMCVAMTNTLDEDAFLEPCAGLEKQALHEDYGLCQAGTSVALNRDGDVLLGAPGSRSWRGAAFKNNIVLSLDSDQSWYQSAADTPTELKPGPDPAVKYYSYLGMSSKVANVIDNKKTYISGAPRSEDVGQVLMFLQGQDGQLSISEEHYLSGEQFGSWFGCDFTVADINHDGKEDIVVGAPFYSEEGVGGAIYVYMNGPKGITSATVPVKIMSRSMTKEECTSLDCENARFGFSVARIGDIDLDLYEDIAVGAPFEGNGAVYIFRGSADGLMTTPSQQINAADLINARPLKSFGYSLSGGNDMDTNGYPDLVVGSYESNKAVVLRARPVIKINAILQVIPERISTTNKQCSKDGRPNNCFEVRACFKFSAEPKEEFTGELPINYTLEADKFTGRVKSRVFFKTPRNKKPEVIHNDLNLNPQTQSPICIEHLVYIDSNNKDFLNPIPFRLTYSLKDIETPTMNKGDPIPAFNTYPILYEKAAEVNKSVSFENNCGDDNTCNCDLKVGGTFPRLPLDNGTPLLGVRSVDQLYLRVQVKNDGEDVTGDNGTPQLRVGSVEQLYLRVQVKNDGEDAHESMLYITLPEHLPYKGYGEDGESERTNKYSCQPNGKLVKCNLGNPLVGGKTAIFTVRLDPKDLPPTTPMVEIKMKANTTSNEVVPSNDEITLHLRVVVETDLFIRGSSDPLEVFYGGEIRGESAIKYEHEIGFPVQHSYEIINQGHGKVTNTTVEIQWPYEVMNPGYKQGKHVLYLMEEPQVDGGGTCKTPGYVINPLQIEKKPPTYNVVNNDTTVEINQRRKREAHVVESETIRDTSGTVMEVVTLDCDRGTAKCFTIRCTLTSLEYKDSVAIRLRSRIWNSTFLEDYKNVDSVHIYSTAKVIVDPALNIKETSMDNNIAKALTKAIPDIQVADSPGVPLWAIIVAAVAGLLLLILIVIILWKCGFFQRRRHPDDVKTHKGKLQKQNYDDDYYN